MLGPEIKYDAIHQILRFCRLICCATKNVNQRISVKFKNLKDPSNFLSGSIMQYRQNRIILAD